MRNDNTKTEQRPAVVVHRPVGLSSANEIRKHARTMLGEILLHEHEPSSYGCVEAENAIEVVEMLVADRNRLGDENVNLRVALRKIQNASFDGCAQGCGCLTCGEVNEIASHILSPNVEVTGDPLKSARESGMYVT